MSQPAMFLTGVTGALGGWIARKALRDGFLVRTLARRAEDESADSRVRRCMSLCGGDAGSPLIDVVEGDLENLPLDPGRIDLIVHCAACTAFQERAAADSHATNVEGLNRVLEIARRKRVPLVHVSTAYVCGDRTGVVREAELSCGQRFNNVYERNKHEGEVLVRRWAMETGLPATILRPGIVLGDWHGGRSAWFNTLYHLMIALDSVGRANGRQRLRLAGDASVTKNIIPVDHFADVAWKIIQRDRPGTFHVTHPRPIRMGELRDIFCELFDVDLGLVPELDARRDGVTSVERMCHRVVSPYRAYMLQPEPVFDQRQIQDLLGSDLASPPVLNLEYFRRLLDYGRAVKWGNAWATTLTPRPADAIDRYFTEFLAARQNHNLLPYLKKLTARFAIAISGANQRLWTLELREGVLVAIEPGANRAECQFALQEQTFFEIAAARLSPRQAFFGSRIKIAGDMEIGLRVASVLSRFFADYPFDHDWAEPPQERNHVRVAG